MEEKDSYEKENNPVLAFIDEIGTDDIFNEPTAAVYSRYCEFCLANGYKAMSKLTFSKRINQALNSSVTTMRVNGKPQKVFIQA
jgi:putative DNA primase/helicase